MIAEAGRLHNTPEPGVRNSDPAVFFQEVCQVFLDAEQAVGGASDRFYTLGGFIFRLRFAGPALMPTITPALAHLETAPVPDPALTVYLWDSASTGAKMPLPPWSADDYLEFGLVDGFNSERIKTLHQSALHMIDLECNEAVYWISDARKTPHHHAITPLRTIFHWWLNRHQRFIVHAAAVGMPGGGVLVTGRGGAGKSTTALSCIGSGLKYAGDENCIISIAPEPYVYSLYSSGTLESEDVGKIPSLSSSLSNANRLHAEKAVYHLFEEHRRDLSIGFPVRAVFVPEVSGKRETSIRRRSSAQTLVALAPGSLFQLPGAGEESFRAMADLVRKVPCYTLALGTDLSRIPMVIERFLRDRI
ncbi:MAG: serine kinase [Chloroflexi bacterium]|nr:serine kinase [Chloroflexota bacterium]